MYYLLDDFYSSHLRNVICLHYYKWIYFHLVKLLLVGFDSIQAFFSVLEDYLKVKGTSIQKRELRRQNVFSKESGHTGRLLFKLFFIVYQVNIEYPLMNLKQELLKVTMCQSTMLDSEELKNTSSLGGSSGGMRNKQWQGEVYNKMNQL